MIEQKLSRVDLNLLIALSVLLKEKNVSKAASVLYVSQPAMSRTLQRLRDTFDDPLFHRTSDGIIPTEKAKKIGGMLPELLAHLTEVLDQEPFDPLLCDTHFTLSIPPLIGHSVVLPLLQSLTIKAPKACVTELSSKSSPYAQLEAGSMDFALHTKEQVSSAFTSTYVGCLDVVLFSRKGHPLLTKKNVKQKKITLDDCLAFNFVGLNVENQENTQFVHPLDALLKKQGKKRHVTFYSNQIQILIALIKTSDNLIIGPSTMLSSNDLMDQLEPVYSFNLPKEDQLKFYLLMHKRLESSEEHQWFKDLLIKQLSTALN